MFLQEISIEMSDVTWRGNSIVGNRWAVHFLLALLTFFASGCSSDADGPKRVPVSGVVTINGKPLPGAFVAFHPTGSTPGRGGSGETDAEGKFAIGNFETSGLVLGVPEGEYKVTVSKQQGVARKPVQEGSAAPATVDGPETIPARFSDFNVTVLTEKIPAEGRTDVKLELRTK